MLLLLLLFYRDCDGGATIAIAVVGAASVVAATFAVVGAAAIAVVGAAVVVGGAVAVVAPVGAAADDPAQK